MAILNDYTCAYEHILRVLREKCMHCIYAVGMGKVIRADTGSRSTYTPTQVYIRGHWNKCEQRKSKKPTCYEYVFT